MNLKTVLVISVGLFSCKDRQNDFDYKTSIASKVYQAQLKYLDNTLFNYARISKKGDFYFQESNYVDETAEKYKGKLNTGGTITEDEKNAFYEHFEKSLNSNGLIDREILKQLKELPIKTVSDVDLLRIYMKNNFVCILLNNKLLPYDSWSTMACSAKSTINEGEEFEVSLANTAWNNAQPNEWFLVKDDEDSLTKENIIDTLHQDETGVVYFKTKNYKKGENTLTFISRLNTPVLDYRMLSRKVTFYVK